MNTDISRVGFSPQSAMPPTGARPLAAHTEANSTPVSPRSSRDGLPQVSSPNAAAPIDRLQTMEADKEVAKANVKSAEAQQVELEAALEKLNQHMRDNARAIEFSVDDVTDRTIILSLIHI